MAEFHEMNFEGLSQYSVKLSVQISSKPDYLTIKIKECDVPA